MEIPEDEAGSRHRASPAGGGLRPGLTRERQGDIAFSIDPRLRRQGVLVAFSERCGGVSAPPFSSLNLASHVGDDPAHVAENRARLLGALGIGALAPSLTMAEQVHGAGIVRLTEELASSETLLGEDGARVVPATDALLTTLPGVPLLMCFADCVPVVLVAPGPAVAVVHAGWRGALVRLPGLAATKLASVAGCTSSEVGAYVGPHICPTHYRVSDDLMSHFFNVFGTVCRAESGGLDLGATVHATLTDAGVPPCSIASLGECTAEETDRYFSYRAEGARTGRHGALVCILP